MGKIKVPLLPGVLFDIAIVDPKKRIQKWIDDYQPRDAEIPETFDSALMREHLKLVSVQQDPPLAIFEIVVPQKFCNRTGMMHGGATAMILDMCTSAAQGVAAKQDFWEFCGVSRSLSLTYLRPIRRDTRIVIECEILQMGKTSATIHGRIYRKDGHLLLCTAEHNKANVDIYERNVKL